MRFSVCIEAIFTDRPFIDRLDAVRNAGIDGFEFWGWRDKDLLALRSRQQASGLVAAGMVLDTGQALVSEPDADIIRRAVRESIKAAQQLDCQTLICTVSSPGGGEVLPGTPRPQQHRHIVESLGIIAPLAEQAGITVVLEPLNVLVDHAGYFLTTSAEGFEIIREVSSPSVRLLFDIYHQQVTEGNLLANILPNLPLIGHFHVADVPGRHEPGTGELNFANIFRQIDAAGYTGFVGLEYWPQAPALETLRLVKSLAPA